MMTWLKPIQKVGACTEAIEWGGQYNSINEAWWNCDRGDWMLWLCGKLSGNPQSASRKKVVLVACECARLALPYEPKGEERPLKTIETAEAWARGEGNITLQDVRAAADAAADATYADAAYADAAYAAAYAATATDAATATAYAAYAAAHAAADAAADATAYAAYAAAYAAYAAAHKSTLKQCADIMRKHYPTAPRKGAK